MKAGRYADARRVLETSIATASENKSFLNALARILAAAPDASLRDGPRALQMAKALFEATRNPYFGQTYAMALAETGDFERAISLQRETVIAYERMGDASMKPFLQKNLGPTSIIRQRASVADRRPIFRPRSPGARWSTRGDDRRNAPASMIHALPYTASEPNRGPIAA